MDLKICTKCNLGQKDIDFNWRNKEKTIRHAICRYCHSKYRKEHYSKNRQKYIDKARKWNTNQREKICEFLFDYLQKHPCVDCGEGDIIVLDFDHLKEKFLGISEMARNCYSIKTIRKEIKKCQVRCANCHRRKTSKERGYWKYVVSKVDKL
jgi:hypothetical protein